MAKSREKYNFSKEMRKERKEGADNRCEKCGEKAKTQGHHLLSCYLALRNPVLAPRVIKQTENLMMLCEPCHIEADEDQKSWDAHEVGIVAWALLDLPPDVVEYSQWTTYPTPSKKKKRKRRKKRRGKKRK